MNGLLLFRMIGFMFVLSPCLPAKAEDEAINMVMNPSFEFRYTNSACGPMPSYWSVYSGTTAGSVGVSSAYKQGDHSLKLNDTNSSAAVGVWSELMPVIPGQVYETRAWAFRTCSSMVCKLYFKYFDESGTNCIYTPPSTSVGSVGSWSEGVKTGTAPTNAAYLRLLFYSDNVSTGAVYVDCVSLTLADQRVNDGDFGDASAGQLPEHWSVFSTHVGAIQDAQLDGGNMALRLYDTNTATACGAYYTVPASPGVPYKLTVSARKVGSGSATVYLKFYDSEGTQISTPGKSTTNAVYTTLTITNVAPANTAYARVLCYINSTDTGTAYFDDVSFTENYTNFYAATAAIGNGSGTNSAHAARHTDSNLWNKVDAAAATAPVKVTFLSGTYSGVLLLDRMGNPTNQIVLQAEKPFGVLYNDAPTNALNIISLTRSENMIIRHFHFSYASNKPPMPYCLGIGSVSTASYSCHDIRIEGCSAVNATTITRGFSGAWQTSSNVIWDRCSAVMVGVDATAHALYSMNANDLTVRDFYSEDISGASLKFRDDCRNVLVENSVFVNTSAYAPDGTNDYFVYIEANNFYTNRHETFPKGLVLSNLTFEYVNPGAGGNKIPIVTKMGGYAPIGVINPSTGDADLYMIPTSVGSYLANTANSAASRNSNIVYYCAYDLMGGDLIVTNCVFTGCSSIKSRLWRKEPFPADGMWEGTADIDALLGLQ